jgi:hypothetical protein
LKAHTDDNNDRSKGQSLKMEFESVGQRGCCNGSIFGLGTLI